MRTIFWAVGALASATIVACSPQPIVSSSGGSQTPPSVASIDITPPSARILIGGKLQLTAQPKDASGKQVSNLAVVWKSSDTTIARKAR